MDKKVKEVIESEVWKGWILFWAAFVLTAAIAIVFWLAGNVWSYVGESMGMMAVVALLYPLKKMEGNKLFEKVRSYPVEAIGLVVFLSWMFIESSIWSLGNALMRMMSNPLALFDLSVVRIHLIWFLMLYATGYLVLYLKDLHRTGFKETLLKNSFLSSHFVRLYKTLFEVDLQKNLSWRLLFNILGHGSALFILAVFTIVGLVDNEAGIFFLGTVGLFIYLLSFWLYSRIKVKTIQRSYKQLCAMAQEMSAGNLDVKLETDLGMFNGLRDELAQVKDGFKTAVEQATASERMKTDLIANVSHDLKTPLTSIITYADLLKDESLSDDKRRQYIGVLEQKSHRLKVLIEDLFEMSRVTSGNIKLDLQPINVVALMKQTLSEVGDSVEEAGLALRNNFPGKPVILPLDGKRTHRVFENLLINMAKYGLPGTRAYIEIQEEADGAVITMRNISASELTVDASELTERFVRADSSRTTEGSGLGLAIAKSLVLIQEGEFLVETDGDLFKVTMTFKK